ncbi:MAG: RdgB/HAM1 family non-canonical purine NTP pyrophosphatase [Pirellulaceae bacterium]|nr:RdgB/HAM1 family non-canonical purine NTP pyrophosphatase [Pirellulaceae bacterium]
MPTIVLASRNRKKLREMADQLTCYRLQLISAADLPHVPDVEEGAHSFAENAALKAASVARATGHWSLGDDSGLEVDALNGAPGVLSSRYAGSNAADGDNNRKLLEQLADVPDQQRTARFVCYLAVADPDGTIRLQVDGVCRGRIIQADRGGGGFGYDPLFLIPEYHRTFGELSPVVKSVLSHRARAFQRLLPQLVALLRSS